MIGPTIAHFSKTFLFSNMPIVLPSTLTALLFYLCAWSTAILEKDNQFC